MQGWKSQSTAGQRKEQYRTRYLATELILISRETYKKYRFYIKCMTRYALKPDGNWGSASFKRPQCLLLDCKKTWLKDGMLLLCLSAKKPDHRFGPLRVHLYYSWNVFRLLSQLTSKPLSGIQHKYIWFDLELNCRIQSDPNHNNQKETKKPPRFRAFIWQQRSLRLAQPTGDAQQNLDGAFFT